MKLAEQPGIDERILVPVVSINFWKGFLNGLWISAIIWGLIYESVRRTM